MKCYVYPMRYVGEMPYGRFEPDYDLEPMEGELINYVSGTEKVYFKGMKYVRCCDIISSYETIDSFEYDREYAFVKIDGYVSKYRSDQIAFEKRLNEYQVLFKDGVNSATLSKAHEIAMNNMKMYFMKRDLSEPINLGMNDMIVKRIE